MQIEQCTHCVWHMLGSSGQSKRAADASSNAGLTLQRPPGQHCIDCTNHLKRTPSLSCPSTLCSHSLAGSTGEGGGGPNTREWRRMACRGQREATAFSPDSLVRPNASVGPRAAHSGAMARAPSYTSSLIGGGMGSEHEGVRAAEPNEHLTSPTCPLCRAGVQRPSPRKPSMQSMRQPAASCRSRGQVHQERLVAMHLQAGATVVGMWSARGSSHRSGNGATNQPYMQPILPHFDVLVQRIQQLGGHVDRRCCRLILVASAAVVQRRAVDHPGVACHMRGLIGRG